MMKYKYINTFPQPFLDDLVENKIFPIVGAGFSKNASIPEGLIMPSWNELGEGIAKEILDYKFTNPIDAISAYAHEYSRTSLIEKVTKALHVNKVEPGKTHLSFCNLPFDILCTTNFDFLLEKGYNLVPRYCMPIIEEEQLAISNIKDGVTLIKLHGDLHHPNRLVLTEEDYDRFLQANPMLATFIGNLLISRTALFIGYSLDDSDFRQIWQLIKDRLGNLKRNAFALKVNCSSHEKARYERRGVKVINIIDEKGDYDTILRTVFDELKDYWTNNLLENTIASEDDSSAELSLPEGSLNRLCYFSIPANLLPYYKRHIFPLIYQFGLVPISEDDVITPGDNIVAKINALFNKAKFAVFDLSSRNTIYELGKILSKEENNKNIIIIAEKNHNLLIQNINDVWVWMRDEDPYDEIDNLKEFFKEWLESVLDEPKKQELDNEPKRLLEKKEYNYSVISAFSMLESYLREKFENNFDIKHQGSIHGLFELGLAQNIVTDDEYSKLKYWFRIRNNVVHKRSTVLGRKAKEIVNGIYDILER